jgi:DNA polymerase I-like protein with 3'-5' exonuclease and polymerase domains/uracil-DNA glycosylase
MNTLALPPPSRHYDPVKAGARCADCALKGHVVVPPTLSVGKTRLVIVGEAPGRMEVHRLEGFCLIPSTLVLMGDLTWRALGDIVVGDEVVGLDEEAPSGPGISERTARQWKIGKVTATFRRTDECYRVETVAGELVGTGDHRVMTAKRRKGPTGTTFRRRWQRVDDLVCGEQRRSRLVHIGHQPWEAISTYEAGWLAGFVDGEGHVLGSKSERVKRAGRVGFTQNEGAALTYAQKVVGDLGFKMQASYKQRSYKGNARKCTTVNISGDLPEMMRFLGLIRPVRLIDDLRRVLSREGQRPSSRSLPTARLIARYKVGRHEVVDITTTCGTFIANGFVVHNCGPSGSLLNEFLDEASFDRKEAHITNAALCRPDDDKELASALACCSRRLANELAALPAKAPILAMGAKACKSLLGRGAIFKSRGFVWHAPEIKLAAIRNAERLVEKRSTKSGPIGAEKLEKAQFALWHLQARALLKGRVVIPTVHPAFLLRGADAWRPVVAVDVKRACRWAVKPFPLENEGKFVETNSPTEAARYLKTFSDEVTVDIETDGTDPLTAKITCVGVADCNDVSKVLVMNPWRRSLNAVLQAALKKRTCVTHNGPSFDIIALEKRGIVFGRNEDTLIAHHAFASHLRQGLDHVASMYCDSAPWKILAKARGQEEKGLAGFGVGEEELAAYNAADVRLDALSWRRMQPDLEDEQKVYEADMQLAALCRRMQIVGIRMDKGRRDELSHKLRRRAAALKGEMRGLVGKRSFNPTKLSDIRSAIFGRFRAPALFITPTGLPSTSSSLLEALRAGETRAGTLADLILRWRSAKKTQSTFLDAVNTLNDGRVHPSWRSFGTVTGRLSCRDPNLQNLPRRVLREELKKAPKERIAALGDEAFEIDTRVREIYVPRKGCEFVYFDLSQSEMRAAAYISGDENFIKTCESGDVHSGNACILFPDQAEMIKSDPKGKGRKFRDVTKNCGFGVLYLAEIVTIFEYLQSQGFDVSLSEVETMFSEIHGAYERYYEYCSENLEHCRRHGWLRTELLGRIRWLGWFPKPTEVANFKVQSFIADLMNERLLEMEPRLPRGVRLVAQIHDAAVFETPSRLVKTVKEFVAETWAKPIHVPASGKNFVIPIEIKTGERLSDLG